ncbi:MAG: SCO family protein [Saprospiraceae bacterium]|nr:SCO family protein [Saprospiraceae bacterium]
MKNLIMLIILISAITLISCKNNDYKLPYLGIHGFKNNDTVYYTLPEFKFSDQNGKDFGSRELKSKPYIAYFFFTSCPSICPRMTQSAGRIQKSLEKFKNDFNIVAFSIDPDRDTFEKLREFAGRYQADPVNWHFLRGEEKKINELGIKGFYVGISKDKLEPGGFMHSEKMVLVDRDGHLRGYYTGSDSEEIKQLIVDMQEMIAEN